MARLVWSSAARDDLKALVSYRVDQDTVTIVALIHGARILRL